MARVRSINPAATLDEDVATMSVWARLLWAYLPCHADREGRLKDSAFALKAALFPGDVVNVDALLVELAEKQHIIRYSVSGRNYIQIRNFGRYQNPHKNEKVSELPAPLAELPESNGAAPVMACIAPAISIPGPDPIPSPERDPVPVEPPPFTDRPWTAPDWRNVFKRAWEERGVTGARAFYGDTGDTKACVGLSAELEQLPVEERAKAQANAPAMLELFFREKGKEIERRHYPFNFFVAAFGRYRMETSARPRNLTPVPRSPENPIPYHLRKRDTPTRTEVPHADS